MRLFMLFAAGVCLCAQQPQSSVLRGRVTDASAAVIPDVMVQASDGATMVRGLTNRTGEYLLVLRPGAYTISADVAGFDRFERTGIVLAPAGQTVLDIPLGLAALAETVTVTAKAPPLESALETRTRNHEEVLEIREVRESSAKDVGEALARIDGVWKVRKGGIANDLVLRGFQQDNINVMIDGERIYGACPNNMDPPAFHVDFAEIDQVEIIKGVYDVRNQGSLGGSINIVNKDPEDGLRITPNFSVGSFGYYNPSLTVSASGPRVSGIAGYSFRRAGPYLDGSGVRFTSYANYRDTARSDAAFRIQTGWFKLGFTTRASDRLNLSYTRQAGGQTLYPYLQMDAVYDNADRVRAAYNLGSRVRAEAYFTRVKHWMTDELRVTSAGAAREFGMGTYAGTRALGGRVEADLAGVTFGIEAFRRGWNAVTTLRLMGRYTDQPSIPAVNTTTSGAYAGYRRTIGSRLHLSAGGRLDRSRSEANSESLNTDLYWAYKGTRSRDHSDTAPSGNVWIGYALPHGVELFLGAGSNVRMPDPQERYFALKRMGSDWVGNPLLQPVRNSEADAGFSYRGRHFTIKPTVFYSRLTNYITVHKQVRLAALPYVTNPAARSFENVNARMYGGELSYSVGISRAVLFSGGVSYARGTKEARPDAGIFDRDLAEQPPLKSRAALRYGNRRFFAEASVLAARAQNRVDSDLAEQRTPGYAVVNFVAGVHLERLNVSVGVDNLFDRLYYDHFSYQRDPFRTGARVPDPGRSLFANVSYAF